MYKLTIKISSPMIIIINYDQCILIRIRNYKVVVKMLNANFVYY